jgi:transcriptional regulator NrdR family protein
MIKKTSQRNYAKTKGIYCPFCRNSNTYALGSFYTFENSAFRRIECSSCGRRWKDKYKLVGFKEIIVLCKSKM